jgi:hypothetical protein
MIVEKVGEWLPGTRRMALITSGHAFSTGNNTTREAISVPRDHLL